MKKVISEVLVILMLMAACQKEKEWREIQKIPLPENRLNRDQLHDALAGTLAAALSDRQVRFFLHRELSRQFTGDYDILFDLIRDREVVTEAYGVLGFSALLEKIALESGIDLRLPGKGSAEYKNLQISAPAFYDDWNPDTFIPEVISLPVDYRENSGTLVRSFHADGNETLVTENYLEKPFLLVRQAERVDAEGMMRVDPDGFVIPEEERYFSAGEVYELSDSGLKSGSSDRKQSIIEVLDENAFHEALAYRRSPEKDPPARLFSGEGRKPIQSLKSASSSQMETPGNLKVYPDNPFSIKISWSQVSGAVAYEIFRQYEDYPNYLLTSVNGDQINYSDRYLSQGAHFTYSVRAVDATGNVSPLTEGLESYASWRTNGNRDVVDKIYISSECWNWCCGLFDGKIELQYKISYLMTPSNVVVAYPTSGANNLGQKTSSLQKGKWCTYSHYLFPWDVRNSSYSYRIKLIEDDGSGEGTTVKLGTSFKIQWPKIIEWSVSLGTEFKIADADEEFGEIIIQYWDWKSGYESYHDGYNLIPKRGIARMYLRQ